MIQKLWKCPMGVYGQNVLLENVFLKTCVLQKCICQKSDDHPPGADNVQ